MYVCGDERCNEHPGVMALHVLFLREHNRLCDELQGQHPDWDDETLYQVNITTKVVGPVYISRVTPILGSETVERGVHSIHHL